MGNDIVTYNKEEEIVCYQLWGYKHEINNNGYTIFAPIPPQCLLEPKYLPLGLFSESPAIYLRVSYYQIHGEIKLSRRIRYYQLSSFNPKNKSYIFFVCREKNIRYIY